MIMSIIFEMVLEFIGGLGLFLYGMHAMSDGLQKVAGSKMRKTLEILTKNKLMGVLIGAFVTGIIQSSSAVTVMMVGFVNAGLMNLSQAVGIIMGANIGTTMTSWLISSTEWLEILNPAFFSPVAVAIGTIMILFCKKERYKNIGTLIVGFGILFIGINNMTAACAPLSYSSGVKDLFLILGKNPVLGFLAGLFITALLQSSSASVGILQSLASLGLVPFNSAVYIIMGQNIGTCVTALLSSIGTSKNAKATAYLHLAFNVIGSLLFSVIAVLFFSYVNPTLGSKIINLTQISIIHSIFNIATTLMLYPFSDLLIKLANFMVRNVKDDDETEVTVHLDNRILNNINFATESCVQEILRMGKLAKKNLRESIKDLLDLNEDGFDLIIKTEEQIDILNHAITKYIVKICSATANRKDNKFLISLFHTVGDIERIGDHCESIMDVAKFMIENEIDFNDAFKSEIKEIFNMTILCYNNSLKAFEKSDGMLAQQSVPMQENIEAFESELRNSHIECLSNDQCDAKTNLAFLDVISNLRRISDHSLNMAQTILSYKPIKIRET
jgi:phosphate:Na+ symporter